MFRGVMSFYVKRGFGCWRRVQCSVSEFDAEMAPRIEAALAGSGANLRTHRRRPELARRLARAVNRSRGRAISPRLLSQPFPPSIPAVRSAIVPCAAPAAPARRTAVRYTNSTARSPPDHNGQSGLELDDGCVTAWRASLSEFHG